MNDLVTEIVKIAKKAGGEILKVYADESSFGVEFKKDDSPLTKADQLANNVIVKALTELDAQIPIISEENKMVPYGERKNFKRFWLVDPLDGTKEFIKRNGEFTVNIALVEEGRPILGVVYVPVSDESFYAFKGGGASHEKNGVVRQIFARKYSDSDEGIRVVCSRSHINRATQEFIDKYNNPQAVSKGSSLKFLLIASGQAEVYPRLGPTMEWDTGAAQIILEESGGEVLQYDTMQPLTYNKKELLNPYFIARASHN